MKYNSNFKPLQTITAVEHDDDDFQEHFKYDNPLKTKGIGTSK